MREFNKYFSVYESVEPPQIIGIHSLDYNSSSDNLDLPSTDDYKWKSPFGLTTTPLQDVQPIDTTIQSDIVNLARKQIGTKYTWGGHTPSTGFDCPGLIQYVYKKNGIDLPGTTSELQKEGVEIGSLADVEEGDLIFTSNPNSSSKTVKMVSKVENGDIFTIESDKKSNGVTETKLTSTSNVSSIRRINNKSSNYIIKYFMNKGLTKSQAKGIYGNLMQESGGNLRAVSKDGHNSYGLAQWTGSRKTKLFSMYGRNPSLKQQLDFLWWELNNTHTDALQALKNTNTVSGATKVFMDKFERPHKRYQYFNRRLKYANSIV